MQPRWVLRVTAAMCLLASLLCGQTTTANLYGIIRDSSGAVVPGAQVTITIEGTTQAFSTVGAGKPQRC